jgi:hypothetical protein
MTTIIFGTGKIKALEVSKENAEENKRIDLNIEPPPESGKCQVCGHPASKRAPFGGLVNRWRPQIPWDEEIAKAWHEAEATVSSAEDPLPWFVSRFGKEKGEILYWSGIAGDSIVTSWECKECIDLTDEGYFEKIRR